MPVTRSSVIREIGTIDEAHRARMARLFYRVKAQEYRATLLGLLHAHGEEHRKRALLGPEIRAALEKEAREHADSVANTIEGLIRAEGKRRRNLSPHLLAAHLQIYARERAFNRAPLIARQEIATARLDAFVAFYRENGAEPLFDFRGPVAECPTCRWLKANGPHEISIVLKVGQPHIGCRHNWRARTRARARLRAGGIRPGRISAGRGSVAGLISRDAFVSAQGGQEKAVAALEALAAAAA